MKDHWKELLKELNYIDGQTIIDIGGAYDPVPVADVVVDLCDLGKGGKSYCIIDICSQKLPFPDKSFDIAICSQTLEDLYCPTLILSEMQRVAKRGVIEVPHRGIESVKNTVYEKLRNPHSMNEIWHFGVGHHKWLIEANHSLISFTPKIQYMLMIHPIPKWTGPEGIRYFWNDNVNARIVYDIDEEAMLENYKSFRDNSREYWE